MIVLFRQSRPARWAICSRIADVTASPLEFKRTNTILYCRRWSETARFYKEQMGLPVSFENEWFIEFKVTETGCLSIANAARATVDAVEGQGVTLTWQVSDLARAKQFLNDRGISSTPIQHKWGAQVLYFYDPEGHRIELWAEGSEQTEQVA